MKRFLIAILFLSSLFLGQASAEPAQSVFVPDPSDLADPAAHYSAPLGVLNVRLRAVPGDTYTIADVNADLDPNDTYVPEIMVHFQADDYPDDGTASNAMLRMRGSSSRLGPQKSYRVKLNTSDPLKYWRGERTLQLNKHPWDLTRVRNKLAFDLFAEIPHINSLRTQLMHVMFDDDANPATPDVDYGLFTHVEKMGKEYLANRRALLEPSMSSMYSAKSNIYKAADFSFRTDPRLALKVDNTPVNTTDFELVLEIENGTSHAVLLQMISAIDSDSTDFATEFAKYFNRNNYLTWLAANILMGNRDTRNQNFALLLPEGSTKFYFLPWDYDGAFGFEKQPDILAEGGLYADWELGISNYWGIPLHQRFLQQPGNLAAVEAAVEELRTQYLTAENIRSKIDSYRPLVEPLISAEPDWAHLPTSSDAGLLEWAGEYERLPSTILDNYNAFRARLEKPMPFWQSAEYIDGRLVLAWDRSVDLQNDAVTYELLLAKSPDFSEGSIVMRQIGLTGTSFETQMLQNGVYYMKVIATDSKGNTQEAFDRSYVGGRNWFGVSSFTSAAFPAKNVDKNLTYLSLGSALSDAASGNELRVLGSQFDGALLLSRGLRLMGGYDLAFSTWSNSTPTVINGGLSIQEGGTLLGHVTVKGKLAIRGGSLRVSGVKVRS